MELHTANKNETLITAGIEIQALNIAIECMLCQVIDNEKDIDWIESILHLASEQKVCLKTALQYDVPAVSKLCQPLMAYNRAIISVCLMILDETPPLSDRSEAALTLSRKQRQLANQLISTIADL
ncbi:hypothetical protein MWU21_003937 [Escherichia coli]|nr:hypothetical protein [Escherichia coli]